MPQPHEFGFIQDEEDWEDEEMDLSGWMSRSPPDNGFGSYEEPPMIEQEPIMRARSSPRNNTEASAQFTPPMQGIAGTPGFISKESAFNPLWVSDASYFPKVTGGVKLTGFGALTVSCILLGAGKVAHSRASKQTQDMLEFNSPYATKLAIVGLMGYLHPVLGLDEGLLKVKTGGVWTAGKLALHGALLIGTVAVLRRV